MTKGAPAGDSMNLVSARTGSGVTAKGATDGDSTIWSSAIAAQFPPAGHDNTPVAAAPGRFKRAADSQVTD
jgi:hypothetical protein